MGEKKDMLESLIASLPQGVAACDPCGNITVFNKRAEEISGYSAAEVVGVPLSQLYDNPQGQRNIAHLLRESALGRVSNHETFLKGKGGELIPVRLSATWLYGPSGETVGSLVYFEDLSSVREGEQRLGLLLAVNNIIAKADTLEAGLQSLAGVIVTLLNATFCLVLTLDDSETSLEVKAADFVPRFGVGHSWAPGRGQLIRADDYVGLSELLHSGESRAISSDDEESRTLLSNFSATLKLTEEIKLLLAVPLKTAGGPAVGLLMVGEVRGAGRSPLTREKVELANAIAAQASILIERGRQYQITERLKQLLAALDRTSLHIRAEKEPEKLEQEVVRLAAELFGCPSAGLYINRPHLRELDLRVSYGLRGGVVGSSVKHDEGVIGRIARTGQAEMGRGRAALGGDAAEHFVPGVILAAPLKRAGEVEAVLFVAGGEARREFSAGELEVMERFAAQAAVALETSHLMGREQRVFGRLIVLQRISEYVLKAQVAGDLEKVLHVILTGVTAGYGLGFNRALLLLLEEGGDDLVGHMGVGHLDLQSARQEWKADAGRGLDDFAAYQQLLEKGDLPRTPLDRLARGLRLPVSRDSADILSHVVLAQRPARVLPEDLGSLPTSLKEALDPSTPLVVVPLTARGQTRGLLIADNKFTQSPITDEDIEWLYIFANVGALAIENLRLVQRERESREQLRSLYEASNALVSSQDTERLLQEIVEQTRTASGAMSVRLILIDKAARAQAMYSAGDTEDIPLAEAARPEGIAAEVMRTGRPVAVGDKNKMADRVNPHWMRDRAEASLCLPLTLQDRRIGVMWVNYERPRTFTEFEIDALQLYVNQAAIAYDSARRMEMLVHMSRTAEALVGAPDASQGLDQIVQSARAVLQAHSAALWRFDATHGCFLREGYAASNIPNGLIAEFTKTEPRLGGTAYTVIKRGRLAVEDVTDTARYPFLGESTRGLLAKLGVQSFIGLSLIEGDEPIGVLYVNFDRPRELSEEELHATLTFANHAAAALKKATLAEQRSKAFEQLSKAQNAARVVAQVTTLGEPRESLRSVVTGTREALNCDVVTLYTYDDDRKEFDYPPEMVGVRFPDEVTRPGTVTETSVVRTVLELDSLYVAPDTANDKLLGKAFARREGIASSVATRLTVRGRPVGVMFVNFREPHEFTEHELMSIDLFAKQAAVAIRNKQLYEQQVRRAAVVQALYEAGRSITSSLDLNEILGRIAEQAWRLASSGRKDAVFVDIKLLDGMRVRSVASYPPEQAEMILGDLGKEVDLEDGSSGRIGIIGRAIRNRMPQRVGNVLEDPDYLGLSEETRSQIVVLIEKGNKLIGVISAEHSDLNAFDDETLRAMESLAAQAGIAIENARQFEELKRTKGMVGSRSALAWMGMASSVWRHAVEGMAINVKNAAALLRRDLERGPTPDTLARVAERITMIERNAEQILQKPITPALSDEGAYSVKVNDLIRGRMARLWQSEPYKSVQLMLELSLEDDATVRASAEWLRRALDVLIDNAVRAALEAEIRRVTVATLRAGPNAEIVVSDTGHGIPEEVSAQLFNSPVRKPPSAKGLGMGLLMAEAIVQTYGGALRVKHTSSSGTDMVIELPLEEESAAPRPGALVRTK